VVQNAREVDNREIGSRPRGTNILRCGIMTNLIRFRSIFLPSIFLSSSLEQKPWLSQG